jgi:hypothetical protein
MWQELIADLFAKGTVVLALLNRSGEENWQDIADGLSIVLKKDGFVALLDLAHGLPSQERSERCNSG